MHDAHLEDFLHQALHHTPATLRRWLPTNKLRENLRQDLVRALDWTRDETFSQNFYKHCPIPNHSHTDYLQRILTVGSHKVLAGIRFKGGDISWPFIEWVAQSFPNQDKELQKQALETIWNHFQSFSPRAIRVHLGHHQASSSQPWPGQDDLCYLAAPLAHMTGPPCPQDLHLTAAQDLSFLPKYQAAFAAFQARDTSWGAEVTASDAEDLQACLKEGLIVEATYQAQWAGLFAVRKQREGCFCGYVVQDLLLHPKLWGKNLAPALQQGAANMLPTSPHDLLYGTIYAGNLPSLATAQRCGRQLISRHRFLTPPHLPL